MPRMLALGYVTWDKRPGGEVLGGTVSYAARAAHKLGWDVAVLTSASPDFEPARDLPGIAAFAQASRATTRFENVYLPDGSRQQRVLARAEPISLDPLPQAWRDPDVLLLGSVAREIPCGLVQSFEPGLVGAVAQGWLREIHDDGSITHREWPEAGRDLAGVHVVFLSLHDVEGSMSRVRELLGCVPIVALTHGWEGMELITREGSQHVPTLPRQEVDPTGAGDVFAAAFLVRYHECQDPLEAAGFASCAASCVVEGVGTSSLGDRAEVLRRMTLRERLIEEGEWDE